MEKQQSAVGSHILEKEELSGMEYSWLSSKKRQLYVLKSVEMRMFRRERVAHLATAGSSTREKTRRGAAYLVQWPMFSTSSKEHIGGRAHGSLQLLFSFP